LQIAGAVAEALATITLGSAMVCVAVTVEPMLSVIVTV
jgi:hypothetical protein